MSLTSCEVNLFLYLPTVVYSRVPWKHAAPSVSGHVSPHSGWRWDLHDRHSQCIQSPAACLQKIWPEGEYNSSLKSLSCLWKWIDGGIMKVVHKMYSISRLLRHIIALFNSLFTENHDIHPSFPWYVHYSSWIMRKVVMSDSWTNSFESDLQLF